jgi:hypothetical protein
MGGCKHITYFAKYNVYNRFENHKEQGRLEGCDESYISTEIFAMKRHQWKMERVRCESTQCCYKLPSSS